LFIQIILFNQNENFTVHIYAFDIKTKNSNFFVRI
jgi:hypothetical protein